VNTTILPSCRTLVCSSVLTSAVDKRTREMSDGAIRALCLTKRQLAAVRLNASAKRSHYQCGEGAVCGRLVAGSNSDDVIDVCLVYMLCCPV
jgi:hypothetical protein